MKAFRIDDAMWDDDLREIETRVKLVGGCTIGIRIKEHRTHDASTTLHLSSLTSCLWFHPNVTL